jgi:cytochrome c556
MTNFFHLTIVTIAIIAAFAVVTRAHEGATGVAKDRMDLMQSMSREMKEISRRVNANRDLAAIGVSAARIRDTAPRLAALFPPGSGTGITDAKPEIWQRWDEFQGKALALQKESAALGAVASAGDPKAIGAQFTALIRACTGCHTDFRRGKADRY